MVLTMEKVEWHIRRKLADLSERGLGISCASMGGGKKEVNEKFLEGDGGGSAKLEFSVHGPNPTMGKDLTTDPNSGGERKR